MLAAHYLQLRIAGANIFLINRGKQLKLTRNRLPKINPPGGGDFLITGGGLALLKKLPCIHAHACIHICMYLLWYITVHFVHGLLWY